MWHNIQHSYEEGTLGIPRLFDYFRYGYMNGRHLTEEEILDNELYLERERFRESEQENEEEERLREERAAEEEYYYEQQNMESDDWW